MLTLVRAKSERGSAGEPLPTVYRSLAANEIDIRRGQLALIAAAPGVGKSAFIMSILLKAQIPALYCSADTDPFTMYLRAGAMVTGWRMRDIEAAVEAGHTATVDAHLNSLNHIRFDFAGRIEVDDLEANLKAYATVYGEWPHAIVIDNLANLDLGDGQKDAFRRLESACDYLHELARETGAAVVALHHVTGEYENGTVPVPLSGLRDKISKVPEVVLTLHRRVLGDVGTLYIIAAKNRNGRPDPEGANPIELLYEPARMRIEDRIGGEAQA